MTSSELAMVAVIKDLRARAEKAEENLKAFLPVLVWVVCPHCDNLEFNNASAEHNCSACGEVIAFPSLWRQHQGEEPVPCPVYFTAEATERAVGLWWENERLREEIERHKRDTEYAASLGLTTVTSWDKGLWAALEPPRRG